MSSKDNARLLFFALFNVEKENVSFSFVQPRKENSFDADRTWSDSYSESAFAKRIIFWHKCDLDSRDTLQYTACRLSSHAHACGFWQCEGSPLILAFYGPVNLEAVVKSYLRVTPVSSS